MHLYEYSASSLSEMLLRKECSSVEIIKSFCQECKVPKRKLMRIFQL
jgi:hypothetical protein